MTAILERHRERFQTNSDDTHAFEALQEHLFLGDEWERLISLYERRLTAPSVQTNPHARADIEFRLGQIWQERIGQIPKAIDCYTRAIRIAPDFRPALQQMRSIHTEREHWDVVLQIAEMETVLEMRPEDRAELLTDIGRIWLDRLEDSEQALHYFRRSLDENANNPSALEGAARASEIAGLPKQAAEAWRRLSQQLRGAARAQTLVQYARLLAGPLNRADAGIEVYRSALTADPMHPDAIEAMTSHAIAKEQWRLLAELEQRRFDLASRAGDIPRQAAIALEAGRLHLEHLGDPAAAEPWFARSQALAPEDPRVYEALADLERARGNDVELLANLEHTIERSEDPHISVLLEAASLRSEGGENDRALRHLERAFALSPEDAIVLEALTDTLSTLGHYEALVDILERRAALSTNDPETRAATLCELGAIQREHMNDEEAGHDAFERAFESNPAAPDLAATLEQYYIKTEDVDSLRSLYERAGYSGSPAVRTRYLCALGDLLCESFGDGAEALRSFERALKLDSRCVTAHRGMQRCAEQAGDAAGLERAYALETRVSDDLERTTFLVRELARLTRERGEFEETLGWTRRWVEVAPGNPEALTECARLEEQMGRESDLLATLTRLDPLLSGAALADHRRRVAELHLAAGRRDAAIDSYRDAFAADGSDLESMQALVQQLEAAGRLRELAEARHQLADLLPTAERAACLDSLSVLLLDQLGDPNGAIEIMLRLCREPADLRPDTGLDARLESTLERAGRFEDLEIRLAERVAETGTDSPGATDLELRRGQILLDHLERFSEAAEAFARARAQDPTCDGATAGLERALRASGNPGPLADFLGIRVVELPESDQRDRIAFERAILLEEALSDDHRAREVLADLCRSARNVDLRGEASLRLQSLLERTGSWAALREHLDGELKRGRLEASEAADLHERIAELSRDRLRDAAGAVLHFEAAGRLAPDRGRLWRALGSLYDRAGRSEDLARTLEAELATNPDPERERSLRSRATEVCAGALADPERARPHAERALELDPAHSGATEFLIEYWEREGQPSAVASLLEDRLQSLETEQSGGIDARPEQQSQRTALQLRIAGVRANQLGDVDGAIWILERAEGEIGPRAEVAEPLADLYARAEYAEKLAQLCQRAAESTVDPDERANWFLRLGNEFFKRGRYAAARQAFHHVLTDRPDDRGAQTALRGVYRSLRDPEPLARLLEAQLSHATGDEEIAARLEISALYAEQLDRPADALRQLRRVLQIEPGREGALEQATALAETLGEQGVVLELVDRALARPDNRHNHAQLLTRRGELLAQTSQYEEACLAYRAALISLGDPVERRKVRRRLRSALEAQGLFDGILDTLYQDASEAEPEQRFELLAEAAETAARHISIDTSLPWLHRMFALRPSDADVAARITDVHRRAGRPEALLRALDTELSLVPKGTRWRTLMLERAELLESVWNAQGRAARVLEDVRANATEPDSVVLESLARLYRATGRTPALVSVLEELAGCADPSSAVALHREAAELCDGPLRAPRRAADHWYAALIATPSGDPTHVELLRALSASLRESGESDGWCRCAEVELEALDPNQPVFLERRRRLHADLAKTYELELARHGDALRHQSALVHLLSDDNGDVDSDALGAAEQSLFRLLRRESNGIELEARLTARLERRLRSPGKSAQTSRVDDAKDWLEVARIRDEQLRAPRSALEAYRRVLLAEPGCLPALHGLRSTAERLEHWSDVAAAIEAELELPEAREPARRAALLGRLGDVCWHRLHSTTRASASYASALESNPRDYAALHSLQKLLESVEDWRGAQDLYESEVAALGDADPERRREVWLRIGDIGRDHTGDPERALRAYTCAAGIRPLSAERTFEVAKLQYEGGHLEAYAEDFGRWCDDPEANATAADHTGLAHVLDNLDRPDAALLRVEKALELDRGFPLALDLQAKLLEQRGDTETAAASLARAAESVDDAGAALRLLRAAALVEGQYAQQVEFLRAAAARDPGNPFALANLARVAFKLQSFEEAERAAESALALLGQRASGEGNAQNHDRALLLEAALTGGHCASRRNRMDVAANFYARALFAAPDDAEAMARYGESLGAVGDFASARVPLEKLLESGTEYARGERARHLAIVGRGLEAAGENEAAAQRFQQALENDPNLDEAHARLLELHRAAGRIEPGIACLERWAESAGDPADFGGRMLQAAEWEIDAGDRTEAAERHLRSALEAVPESVRAWQLLTCLMWDAGRVGDALDVSTQALSVLDATEREGSELDGALGLIALVQGRAFESTGRRQEAAAAYALAVAVRPECIEAVLAQARLLRAMGEWREAADALADFVGRHPGDDPSGLAEVLQHLGRLLAGPLEEIDTAVTVYRRAIALDPEHRESRAMLAGLLSLRPGDWEEARGHHAVLLDTDPANARLLQSVLRTAQSRGAEGAAVTGVRILHALGIASPCAEGREHEPDPRGVGLAGACQLSNPLWEKVRSIAVAASDEISQALDSSGSSSLRRHEGKNTDFRTAALTAEAELTAPALLPLTDARLREVLTLLAALVLDPERARGEGQLVNALSSALGRRARRRLQKILSGESLETIEQIDFSAWRIECRALAWAVALDQSKGSFRGALVAIASADTRRGPSEPDVAGDISDLVSASPVAKALLRRAVQSWLHSI